MKSFDDSMFNAITHFSKRLGPLATLADRMLDLLIPKAVAKASCPDGWYAYSCPGICCGGCGGANPQMLVTFWYSGGSCQTCSSLWC